MMVRVAAALSGIAIGLAAFEEAAAQYYPAPYPSVSGRYRVIPLPDDDDLLDAPDDYRGRPPVYRIPQAEPYVRGRPTVPYPPEEADLAPYERRYGDRAARGPYGQPRQPQPERSSPEVLYGNPAIDQSRAAPRPPTEVGPRRGPVVAALPPDDQPEANPRELPPQFRRQLVNYSTREPAGTIIIDTAHTYLYLVMGNGTAIRYGIGVGREGFTWAGRERISRMAEWPDWHPPADMIERQPYLPRFMAGGEGNPLGARALYLGKTLYRIHGTNQPSTIGKFVSSGCIRMLNEDVEDLYQRIAVGTQVVVLPGRAPLSASVR